MEPGLKATEIIEIRLLKDNPDTWPDIKAGINKYVVLEVLPKVFKRIYTDTGTSQEITITVNLKKL